MERNYNGRVRECVKEKQRDRVKEKKARATKQNSNKSIVNDQDQQHWNRDTLKLKDKRFSMNNLS